jgi:hypothetical protein
MAQTELNCVHQHYLNTDIHKLILKNDSTAAVDDALAHLKKILQEHPAEDKLRLFIDARSGVPPLQYFFAELRKVYAAQEQLPEIRAVYLYKDSIVLSVIQMFFNALRMNASRRFMKNGTDIEAQAWLMSNEN